MITALMTWFLRSLVLVHMYFVVRSARHPRFVCYRLPVPSVSLSLRISVNNVTSQFCIFGTAPPNFDCEWMF